MKTRNKILQHNQTRYIQLLSHITTASNGVLEIKAGHQ